jgi:hypothetical protein
MVSRAVARGVNWLDPPFLKTVMSAVGAAPPLEKMFTQREWLTLKLSRLRISASESGMRDAILVDLF